MVFFESTSHPRFWWVQTSLILLLLLNTAAVAQQPSAQPSSTPPSVTHKRSAKAAKKIVPVPEPPPAPPPPPPTLEQMPAQPPQVQYSQGRLTIVAENSTLVDILRAVRAQTGAVIEAPPSATERVVAHFGPGPARDVLASLLNGSHFNYVMIGSPAHPDGVERLILTSKSAEVPEGASTITATSGNNQVQVDDQEPQTIDIAEQPVDNQGANAETQAQPNAQAAKTPEQMLHELQQQQLQLQQQQEQQQQQQGGPN